jgi:predicted methyltransferase
MNAATGEPTVVPTTVEPLVTGARVVRYPDRFVEHVVLQLAGLSNGLTVGKVAPGGHYFAPLIARQTWPKSAGTPAHRFTAAEASDQRTAPRGERADEALW